MRGSIYPAVSNASLATLWGTTEGGKLKPSFGTIASSKDGEDEGEEEEDTHTPIRPSAKALQNSE